MHDYIYHPFGLIDAIRSSLNLYQLSRRGAVASKLDARLNRRYFFRIHYWSWRRLGLGHTNAFIHAARDLRIAVDREHIYADMREKLRQLKLVLNRKSRVRDKVVDASRAYQKYQLKKAQREAS